MLFEHLYQVGPSITLYAGAGAVLLADMLPGRKPSSWALALAALLIAADWSVALGAELPTETVEGTPSYA